jgi:hypothetical protein
LDERQFSTIVDKLDKILKLLAIETVRGKEKEQEKIDLLDSLGFKASEIDRLLGKSPGYSSVVMAQLKRKKQPKVPADIQTNVPSSPEVVA